MVYAELVSESAILEAVKDLKSVVIVGCPVCANLSIAYEKDLPAYEKSVDEPTGEATFLPRAINIAAHRLKTLLERQGIEATVEMHRAPCLFGDDDELAYLFSEGVISPEVANRDRGSDAVVSLGCPAGTLGLKKRLGDSARVVPAMKRVGIGQFDVAFDETGRFVHVDRESSTIISTGEAERCSSRRKGTPQVDT